MTQLFKFNLWMILFAGLLLFNIITGLWLNQLLTETPESFQVEEERPLESSNTVTLKPEIINHFIQQQNTTTTQQILSSNQLKIIQNSEFLGQPVKTNILTTPVVIGHNKLRLDIDKVKVAKLPLSKKQTLNVIKQFGDLPDNVSLDVKNECFYYEMPPIEFQAASLELTHINQAGWHFNITIKE